MRLVFSPSCAARDALIDVPVEVAYSASLDDGRHVDRPWVMLSMVVSLDGSTVVDGTSGGLSNATDSAVLIRLRSIADVIIVGSGTARSEGYGPPSKPGQRIGLVTGSGVVDTSTNLFASGSGFVITTEQAVVRDADGNPAPANIDVVRSGTDRVDLAGALSVLGQVVDTPRVVQAEGGPTLNGALLDADMIDEIDITTSPRLVGGAGPRLTDAALDLDRRFELVTLAVDDDHFVFGRWRRRRG